MDNLKYESIKNHVNDRYNLDEVIGNIYGGDFNIKIKDSAISPMAKELLKKVSLSPFTSFSRIYIWAIIGGIVGALLLLLGILYPISAIAMFSSFLVLFLDFFFDFNKTKAKEESLAVNFIREYLSREFKPEEISSKILMENKTLKIRN